VQKFTLSNDNFNTYLCNLKELIFKPKPFINIIIQSYNETNLERLKELKYCIDKNLKNPYVKSIHDFGSGIYNSLDEDVKKEYNTKYIVVSNPDNKWLTYEMAFKYANEQAISQYGTYWCIINLDIFLDSDSPWYLTKNRLNDNFIYAQSRHEFNILPNGECKFSLDNNFAQIHHAHTQDAWLFKTPIDVIDVVNVSNTDNTDNNYTNYDFEIGFLGCDNAIANRLHNSGYKLINQPETYKIFHYDITKGKNSSNFMEKHSTETKEKENKKEKPKNKYPERSGSFLVPNYDKLTKSGQDIDMISLINSIGGCSNWEKYEFISKLFSERIIINNP